MAADVPALTIRRKFPRTDEALVRQFDGVPTGWAVDARGGSGALDHAIHAITRATRFVGTAVTVWTRGRDNLAPYAALDSCQAGDVLVVATDGYAQASVLGDILLGMASNAGVVAVVTDGMVRDVPGLDEVGIPVFARGVTPNSPFKDGPGEIGLPVAIGGLTVESGDVVLADGDGVVVVPRARAGDVLAQLANVRANEAKMDQVVKSGVRRPGWLDNVLATKNVRWIE